jgi:hypothetical protein
MADLDTYMSNRISNYAPAGPMAALLEHMDAVTVYLKSFTLARKSAPLN